MSRKQAENAFIYEINQSLEIMSVIRYTVFLAITYIVSVLPALGQVISWEYLSPTPEPITNQAVASARVGDTTFVFTFAGMDASLSCEGDHLRVYAYNSVADSWRALPPIEDEEGGKIAAAANTIDNQVYVVGGYHLSPACDEISSAKIHRFDPIAQVFLADGADLPVPIDDQVQAVWRDSLLYVITGWSNTTNVPDVQVYDPAEDEWQAATTLPGASPYRVFGASGVIIGDTIYYAGGARIGFNFPATTSFRKGAINPENPLEIAWSTEVNTLARGYRMAAGLYNGQAIWLGGSAITYNFDARAYSNNSVVPPLDRILRYDPSTGQLDELMGFIPAVMDFRGMAELGEGEYILVGGIREDRRVSNEVIKITISDLTNNETFLSPRIRSLTLGPNPTTGSAGLLWPKEIAPPKHWKLVNSQGQQLENGQIGRYMTQLPLNLTTYPTGAYWLQVYWEDGSGCSLPIEKM